jgi:hypothetical protein
MMVESAKTSTEKAFCDLQKRLDLASFCVFCALGAPLH